VQKALALKSGRNSVLTRRQDVDIVHDPILGELPMKRFLAMLILAMPVVLSGCAGCSYNNGRAYDSSYMVGSDGQVVPSNIEGGGTGVSPQSGRH
jgi:hypothetical protein